MAALEARLGIPLGSTLGALIAKAYEVRPDLPSEAFLATGLRLRWIDPDFAGTVDDLRQPSTPVDVLPIIETGLDLQHFGLLMRRSSIPFFGTATDKRSIVNVVADDPPAEAFARNLRSLLSIAATTGLAGVTREDLRLSAALRSPDGPAFLVASRHLVTIPGVQRLQTAASALDLRDLTFVYPEEQAPPFKPPPLASWYGGSAHWALRAAEQCVANGFPAEALEFCALALEHIERGTLEESSAAPLTETLAATLRADYLRQTHFVRLDAAAKIKDPELGREVLAAAYDSLASLSFLHAAYWRDLRGRMSSLGIVDPQLGARLEERAAAAERDSL